MNIRFKLTPKKFGVVIMLGVVIGIGSLLTSSLHVSALSGSDWSAGHIIDNNVFTNANSMSVQQIQNFLNSQVSCDTSGSQSMSYYYNSSTGRVNNSADSWITTTRAVYGQRYDAYNGTSKAAAPYVCLPQYVENPSTLQNNLQNPNASISGGESAAQIIWNAAQQYQINPQVLIVTLQKEQGLVTDSWPWTNEYQIAMGYACPDTAPCNTEYYGFYNQVSSAASQFRRYLTYPNNYNYVAGNNTILYNPSASCGSSTVAIQDQATAALYDYTPYQPNAGALAGLSNTSPGGTATCGAYGNRNFWWYFNTWFGSPYFTVNVSYTGTDNSVDSSGDVAVVPVVLTSQPVAPIVLNYAVNSSVAKIMGQSSLTFTPSNWNVPQDIVVQGLASSSDNQDFSLYVQYINSPTGAYSQSITSYIPTDVLFWENTSEAAIYRMYDSTTGKHAYATSQATVVSLEGQGYAMNTTIGYQCTGSSNAALDVNNSLNLVRLMGSSDIPSTSALMPGILYSGYGDYSVSILASSGDTDTVLSTSPSEISNLEQNGFSLVSTITLCNQNDVPVYRLYDPRANTHFYTTSSAEVDSTVSNGDDFEGVAFYNSPNNNVPVYRLYDPVANSHFWTTSRSEVASVENYGFQYEGIAWDSGTTSTPVYRLYDPSSNTHFYTATWAEALDSEQMGYQYEGIAFDAK
jgi:hypothetical protein